MDVQLDDDEVERLIVTTAQPTVALIVSRYLRDGTLTHPDAEDVVATVNLRLIEKMRRVRAEADAAVEKFDSYVAMVTYNAVNDHLRGRYPARTRLKNKLRYVLTHDPRLSLSVSKTRMTCGLRQWPESNVVSGVMLESLPVTLPMQNSARPADALVAILTALGRPAPFDALVRFTATLWNVVDAPPVEISSIPPERQVPAANPFEMREYLRALWIEIRQLPPMQRKALLLNLRESQTVDAIGLLILTGTAGFSELADALGMSPEDLAAIWNDLPLDDLRIAAMLNLTRQQVINLRKSARARLNRRMLPS